MEDTPREAALVAEYQQLAAAEDALRQEMRQVATRRRQVVADLVTATGGQITAARALGITQGRISQLLRQP
jgi:DNA-directed RNA polymerase specialized sigma subunit